MSISKTLEALVDETRREILILLKNGKLSAGEIADKFNMTQAAISYHLNKLKNADLIFETKYKNYIYYELNTSLFEEVLLWIQQFRGGKK